MAQSFLPREEKGTTRISSPIDQSHPPLDSIRPLPSPPLPTFFNKVSQIAASIGIHANMLPDPLNFQRANPRDTRPVPRPSPCTNLNRRFPPHSSPRRFAIFISNLSSSPITFSLPLSFRRSKRIRNVNGSRFEANEQTIQL